MTIQSQVSTFIARNQIFAGLDVAKHSIAVTFCNHEGLLRSLSVSHRSSNGKPLRRPRLDRSGCGRLKHVSRKAFDVAVRSRQDNGFKRTYQRALEKTHDATHARLTGQRKIVSTLRAIWLTMTAYCDELSR